MQDNLSIAEPSRSNLGTVRAARLDSLPWRIARVGAKVLGTVLVISGMGLLAAVGALWYYQQQASQQINQQTTNVVANSNPLWNMPAVPTATPAKGQGTVKGPPATYAVPVRIVIPDINVDAKVVTVTITNGKWNVANEAAGHSQGTANPGQNGNMVISAHDDIEGSLFHYLGNVKVGDPIIVYTANSQYVYIAQSTPVVLPTDTAVMNPTPDPELTLITCTPYWVDTHRQLVIARLYQDPTTGPLNISAT